MYSKCIAFYDKMKQIKKKAIQIKKKAIHSYNLHMQRQCLNRDSVQS